jgi:hypothetical protein
MKQTLKVNHGGSRVIEPEKETPPTAKIKTKAAPVETIETKEDEVKKDADKA